MVDILLFLLVFFLMTWNLSRSETELDVKVPKSTEGKESRRATGEIILNIKPDGRVVMNRREMDSESLRDAMVKIAEIYPDQTVVIRADQNASYRHIVEVLDICKKANIWNVAFATSRPE